MLGRWVGIKVLKNFAIRYAALITPNFAGRVSPKFIYKKLTILYLQQNYNLWANLASFVFNININVRAKWEKDKCKEYMKMAYGLCCINEA